MAAQRNAAASLLIEGAAGQESEKQHATPEMLEQLAALDVAQRAAAEAQQRLEARLTEVDNAGESVLAAARDIRDCFFGS